MFKAVGNVLHKTPWWGLILGGVVTLALLVLFTVSRIWLRDVQHDTLSALSDPFGVAALQRDLPRSGVLAQRMRLLADTLTAQGQLDEAALWLGRALPLWQRFVGAPKARSLGSAEAGPRCPVWQGLRCWTAT